MYGCLSKVNRQENFRVENRDVLLLMENSIQQGMSIEKLLAELSLPTDLLSQSDGFISFPDCWRIIIANQNAIQEESHLMSSRRLKKGTTRLVFSNLHHAKSLTAALGSLAETYNIVHGGDYNFVRKRGGTVSFVVDDTNFHYAGKISYFALEFAIIRIHCAVSILAGKALRLVRVCTKRPVLPKHHHHLLILNSRIVPAQPVYELAYDISQSDEKFVNSEITDLSGYILDQYLNLLKHTHSTDLQNGFAHKVEAAIIEQVLHFSSPSQKSVASALNMSVATLRRKLGVCRLTYRQVLDTAFGEMAINMLQDQLNSADVAERLGYSDVRSFKRAFRRWHGVSPAAYKSMSENVPLKLI